MGGGCSGRWVQWAVGVVADGCSGRWVQWPMGAVADGCSGRWVQWPMGAVADGCSGRWVRWVLAGFMVWPMGATAVVPVVGAMGGDGCGGSDGGDMVLMPLMLDDGERTRQQTPLSPIRPVASAICTLEAATPSTHLLHTVSLQRSCEGCSERVCGIHSAQRSTVKRFSLMTKRPSSPPSSPTPLSPPSPLIANPEHVCNAAFMGLRGAAEGVREWAISNNYFCEVAAADGKQLNFSGHLSKEECVWLQHEVSSFLLSLPAESV
ncbi:unnamed protein product [Closterium sp. NIES-64]|nr:unnamed protein product [Closterium sp. NIES-64]